MQNYWIFQICTDINLGGILSLIETNIQRNAKLLGGCHKVAVLELDFTQLNWSPALQAAIDETDIILAADGTLNLSFLFILN